MYNNKNNKHKFSLKNKEEKITKLKYIDTNIKILYNSMANLRSFLEVK